MRRTVCWIDTKTILPSLWKANVTAEIVVVFQSNQVEIRTTFVRFRSPQAARLALHQTAQTPWVKPLGYASNCDFVLRLTVEPPYRAAHPVLQRSNLRSQSRGGL